MGILGGNPAEEPMHYGEVFGIWSHLQMAKSCMSKYQLLINHTGDKDLKNFLYDMLENVIQTEVIQSDKLLKENGIVPPPAAPEKPFAELNTIPAGARMTDPEIASCVSNDIAKALVSCSQIIGISTREDIAASYAKHHAQLVLFGGRLLRITKDKGWLVLPPLHTKEPAMAKV